MSNPLVSVVVTLFNYEQYVKDCIRSILNQTYDNIEIVVVDDCSTDSSVKVAKSFEGVKVIEQSKNSGYSVCKNEGIIASRGEYIVMLDADDMLTRKSIAARMKKLRKSKADFVHAMALTVKASSSLESCYEMTKGRRQTPKIHAQTVLLARRVHQQFGLYDETLRSRSDKEMWWRLFGKGCAGKHRVKKVYVKKDVAYYRRHNKSMMARRKKNKKYNKEITKLLELAYQERKKNGITKNNTRFLES